MQTLGLQGDRAESNRRQTDSQSVSGNQHRTRPQRKERELNPQGTRKRTRPASNRFPSPFGLPFRICPLSLVLRPWPGMTNEKGPMTRSSERSKRKAWDSNPHAREGTRISSAVRPTVSGYLPFLRRFFFMAFHVSVAYCRSSFTSSTWRTSKICEPDRGVLTRTNGRQMALTRNGVPASSADVRRRTSWSGDRVPASQHQWKDGSSTVVASAVT